MNYSTAAIHRIATPVTITSNASLRQQNQDLQNKHSSESRELRAEVQELKQALNEATDERTELEVELFSQTQALKITLNEQERKLRQARVDRLRSTQPQAHDPHTLTASQFERQHGALGGAAYDARQLQGEVLALRQEAVTFKRANAALQQQLVHAQTRVRRLEATSEGVAAAGAFVRCTLSRRASPRGCAASSRSSSGGSRARRAPTRGGWFAPPRSGSTGSSTGGSAAASTRLRAHLLRTAPPPSTRAE